MSWPVGTIVVCVDASPLAYPGTTTAELVEGHHYTIRSFFEGMQGPAVHLNEIACSLRYDAPRLFGVEAGFRAVRFRLAEGGTCESERARARQPITTHEKANK